MSLNSTAGDVAADSYASLAETDAYFLSRNVTTWTGADTVKEAALRRATTYLDNQYRLLWVGITATQTQSLCWPRVDGTRGYYTGYTQLLLDINGWPIPSNVVPTQIKTAAMETALLALGTAALEPVLDRGGQIKSIGKSVGPLRKDITYVDGAPVVSRYLVVEGLLAGLVKGFPGASSGNVRLVRS